MKIISVLCRNKQQKTMKYDKRKLVTDLTNIGIQMERHEIAQIAAIEHITPTTVKTYLNGRITILALAEAILNDAKSIIKKR